MSSERPRILPRCLRRGSRVAVIAPAGRPSVEAVERGVQALSELGLEISLGRRMFDEYGHLAGADRDRAADFMEAFLDPSIDGVFCARGGVGCARILEYLDLDAVARSPKVFLGYSDITMLHLAMSRRCGWPTFYGPMVSTEFGSNLDATCLQSFWRLVSQPAPAGVLPMPAGSEPPEMLIPGEVEGLLTGGCLCLVSHSLGTPGAIDATNRILCLEDIHERPWRVDRMLTHLKSAGVLSGAAGFLIGRLTDVDDPQELALELAMEKSLLDHLGDGKPLLTGFPFGHIRAPLTIPLNCRARLDASAGTLSILEAAVAS